MKKPKYCELCGDKLPKDKGIMYVNCNIVCERCEFREKEKNKKS